MKLLMSVTFKDEFILLRFLFPNLYKPYNQKLKSLEIMKDKVRNSGSSGAVYGIGMIGAMVYYIQTATTFWMGVLGVFKALVWPAFLVYEGLKAVGA